MKVVGTKEKGYKVISSFEKPKTEKPKDKKPEDKKPEGTADTGDNK